MKIGVFDSGVGGRSFVLALQDRFPDAEIVYKEDRENLPYGTKTPEQLLALTSSIFRSFETEGCQAVLVACNTLTTNVITELRKIVTIPLVGVEPMVKPAAQMTRTGVIAVCATPGTLQSKRYKHLKQMHAPRVTVLEPDCSDWALLVEENKKEEMRLKAMIDELRDKKTDVVVLGCTHYHWIEKDLKKYAQPDIQIIQPIKPVLDQLERVLSKDPLLLQ